MENSAGSAEAEMSKVEETITFKLNALKETWTGFLQELVNRDAVKGVIDVLTNLSEAITSIGPVGTGAIATGLIAGLKLLGSQTDSTGQKIFSFGKILRSALGTDVLRSEYLESYSKNLSALSASAAATSIQTVKMSTAEKESIITKAGLAVASKTQLTDQEAQIAEHMKNVLAIQGEIKSENDLTAAKLAELVANGKLSSAQAELIKKRYLAVEVNKSSNSVLGKVTAAMSEQTTISGKLGAGWSTLIGTLGKAKTIFGLVVAGIVLAGTALIAYKKKQEQAIEDLNSSVQSSLDAYNEAANTARTTASTISGLKDEYASLSKGVNNLGENVSLSNDDFDRYKEISNQIADLLPELVDHWTEEGDAVLTCKDNVNELTEAYKQLSVEAASTLINGTDGEGGADDILKDFQNTMNGVDTFFVKKEGLKDQKEVIDQAAEGIEKFRELSAKLKQDSNLYDSDGNYLQNLLDFAYSNSDEKSAEKYKNYVEDILGAIASIQNYGGEFDVEVPTFNIADNGLETYLSDLNAIEKSVKASGKEISSQMTEARNKVKSLAEAYLTLDDNNLADDQKNAIKSYISSLDDDVIDGLDTKEDVNAFVDSICTAMAQDTTVSNAIIGLFSISKDATIAEAQNVASVYIEALKKALREGKIDQATYDNVIAAQDTWYQDEKVLNQNASRKVLGDIGSDATMAELAKFDAYTDQLTTEQRQKWREWANSVNESFTTAEAGIKAFEDSLNTGTEEKGFSNANFSKMIEEFDKVNEAYQKVAENIKKGKIGKEIASDINDVEALRETFEGIDFSKFTDFSSFDEIETVLSSGASSAEEVQSGWNALATAYWNTKLAAAGYSEEAQKLISTQLQEAGVTKESADAFVSSLVAMAEANDIVANSSKNIADMSAQEMMAFANESTQSEATKQALYQLYLEKIACGETVINTSSDINNLYNLAVQAGATTTQLEKLAQAKALVGTGGKVDTLRDQISSAKEKYGANSDSYKRAKAQYESQIKLAESAAEKIAKEAAEEMSKTFKENQASANIPLGMGYQPTSSSNSGSGSSDKDKDTEDKWLKAYEKAYEKLGKLRDRDKIDEYEYLQYTRALYEKYFNSTNTTNKEWNEYVKLKQKYDELIAAKAKLAKENSEVSNSSVTPEIQEEKDKLEDLTAQYEKLQKELEAAKEARKAALSDDWMGNVNLNDRPTVGGLAMEQAGWKDAGGIDSYSTVYTNTTAYDNPNGGAWVVQFTPILPDGTVMDEQSCYDYLDDIIDGALSAEEVMAKDKANKGILFGVFDSYETDDGQIYSIDWDDELRDAEDYYQSMAELRHEDQADIYAAEGDIVEQQQQIQAEMADVSAKIKESVGDTEETVKEATEGTGESAEEIEKQIQSVQTKLAEAEKNMSDDTREYLENLEEAEYNYLSGMKSLYESVFSWIEGKLEKQISKIEDQKSKATDSLNKQKTAAVNALKAEKEAAVAAIEAQIKELKNQQKEIEKQIDAINDQIDAYNDQIDAINDEKDAIEDANEAREREIALQEALYNLDKLNSQRTNLVYSESQGMHYESDLSGIRDAREDVEDAKDDIKIANLEKEIDLINDKIDALNDEIDKLEEKKDALDDLIDELEDQKDAVEDYYDKLIDETETYWDNLIEQTEEYYDKLKEGLEKQKTGLEEWVEKVEDAKQRANFEDLSGFKASDVFDEDGQIINQDLYDKAIAQMQQNFSNIVTTISEGNAHVQEQFSEIADVDLSQTTDAIESTADAFKKLSAVDFDVVKSGIDSVKKAFSSLSEDKDVAEVLGRHIAEGVSDALDKTKDSSELKEKSKEVGKTTTENVGEGMTSTEATEKVEEGGKEVVKKAAESVDKAAKSEDTKETTDEAGTAITGAVSDGMTSDNAKTKLDEGGTKVIQTAATSIETAATSEEANLATTGEAIVTGIINNMLNALNGAAGVVGIQQFVNAFATALQEEFAKLDSSQILDLNKLLGLTSDEEGGTSLTSIFETLSNSLQSLNEIDMSSITEQFENLRDAITGARDAICGSSGESASGTETSVGGSLKDAMESFGTAANQVFGTSGGEEEGGGEGAGGGVISKFATLKTKVNDVTTAIGGGGDEEGGGENGQSSGGKKSGESSEGSSSLTQAMEDFGTTADEVLGGGEDGDAEEGEGVIGQFATLKTKVDDVTAAIGVASEGGDGGTGDGGEDATLISALETEEKVALDEEKGLPKQISLWEELCGAINSCVTGINNVKKALEDLYEFSLYVSVGGGGHSGGSSGGAKADGTFGYADGSFNVATHGYADGSNVGLSQDQSAYVGEVGEEMLIRAGRATLIGKNGAERMNLKKGDIIFSHSQTKELLKNGKIHSRGKAVGTHAYADGTPFSKMLKFAGEETTSATITMIANQLTGNMPHIVNGVDKIERNVADMMQRVSSVSNVANQNTSITIGDIHVSGVQDTDSFAKAIKSYLPSKMLQELHK